MKGAREYASIFSTSRHGKLALVSGSHARGKTFHIYVLPADVSENYFSYPMGDVMPWRIEGAVEVYGVVSGQPGWTESYGWLHRGPWVEDFEKLVEQRKAELSERERKRLIEKQEAEDAETQRKLDLLSKY